MFISYDSITFGKRLKELRKSLRLSQQDVSTSTGVNSDTLRRIENGSVVPKFETLEVLSHHYKTNLLKLLDSCKVTNVLMTMYEALDRVILKGDLEELSRLQTQLDSYDKTHLVGVDMQELDGFHTFLEAMALSYQDDQTSKLHAIIRLKQILTSRHPLFDIEHLELHYFTHFEHKVLLVLAVTLAECQAHADSNTILTYLNSQMPESSSALSVEKQLRVKILINLAYNMHLVDNHEIALQMAEQGIAYCCAHDLLYGLHFLYYRKSIALYHLKQDHIPYLKLAFDTLSVQGLSHIIPDYIQTLKTTYNLDYIYT